MKADSSKVNPILASAAIIMANGDRKAAYSRYIQLHYRQTGDLAPGIDNRDLQKYFDERAEVGQK